jgi:hypothetical protein
MKERKHMKTKTHIIHAAFAAFTVACLAFIQNAQAVSPPPDGGYPGGNTAEGASALFSLTTGGYNAAVGYLSLRSDATGSLNTAIGAGTLLANTADSNTATGAGALFSNTTGTSNAATGAFALFANTDGAWNNAVGFGALQNHSIGNYNSAFGDSALNSDISGAGNTAIGAGALLNSTGNTNTALGDAAGASVSTANSVICIGTAGQNVSNSCYIGNIAGQTVGAGGTTCYVDNFGKLGVYLSARRFKTDIADMAAASEALLALRPVTFHYKPELDKAAIPQFGLVAEEVAKVNPDLVTHDAKGDLYTVRYEAINVMLLNEFLKQHCKVDEQEVTIAELKSALAQQQKESQSLAAQQQKEIKALAASLKEQASDIQKVSAQINSDRPTSKQITMKDR